MFRAFFLLIALSIACIGSSALAGDYYSVLGVSRTATQDEIKKAFRRLALEMHPDRNGSTPAANEAFKNVTEAYNVVGDAEKRRIYDDRLRYFESEPPLRSQATAQSRPPPAAAARAPVDRGFSMAFQYARDHKLSPEAAQAFAKPFVNFQRTAQAREYLAQHEFIFAFHLLPVQQGGWGWQGDRDRAWNRAIQMVNETLTGFDRLKRDRFAQALMYASAPIDTGGLGLSDEESRVFSNPFGESMNNEGVMDYIARHRIAFKLHGRSLAEGGFGLAPAAARESATKFANELSWTAINELSKRRAAIVKYLFERRGSIARLSDGQMADLVSNVANAITDEVQAKNYIQGWWFAYDFASLPVESGGIGKNSAAAYSYATEIANSHPRETIKSWATQQIAANLAERARIQTTAGAAQARAEQGEAQRLLAAAEEKSRHRAALMAPFTNAKSCALSWVDAVLPASVKSRASRK